MTIFMLENINAGYDEKPVLANLNLDIEEGEFIAIIGPNGAGKSTLMRTLSGNLSPGSGKILFRDHDLTRYRPRRLARMFSTVYNIGENVLPFSVYEFIRMGRFPHQRLFQVESEEDSRTIRWAVETTGISPFLDRSMSELSSGEFQLVLIAHALAQNSSCILLDEPISHLDIRHSVEIMDILHHLNKQGATIVAVLHDINIASDYCSRIVGMKEGAIFLNGSPEEVLKYELVEELFETSCIVLNNPTSGKPFVYPVPAYVKKDKG
jgi:iron complex transport system ATP-binding protein